MCVCLRSERELSAVQRAGKAGPGGWEPQPVAIYALAIGDTLGAKVLQQRGEKREC